MASILETKNLVKIYHKRTVVDHVSLFLAQGEVVGILGPNGAGKTTTFRMVVGLIAADEGEIWFDGKEISKMPMYARARLGIGYLPQEPSVFTRLTVRENIEIIMEHLKISRKERIEKLETLLDEMKLASLSNSKAGTLSGGERRRLEVARSLVTSPAFLMLDEPFAAIDPKIVEGLQEVILNLKAKNIGILITDHKARETLSITDRTYIINKGCILKHGKTAELVEDEQVRKLYLGKQFFMPEVQGMVMDTEDRMSQAKKKMEDKKYQEAAVVLTEIIALDPHNVDAIFQRGLCFYNKADFVSASVDFQTACTLNSQFNKAQEMLSECRKKLGYL